MPVFRAFNLAAVLLFAILTSAQAQTGSASWYALDGNLTANGERMNSTKMTAAHRTLPFGAKVKVTNLSNGRSVVVRINDRGPFAKQRIIDLSKAAARVIGMVGRGHAKVQIVRVSPNTPTGRAPRFGKLAALQRVAMPAKRPAP